MPPSLPTLTHTHTHTHSLTHSFTHSHTQLSEHEHAVHSPAGSWSHSYCWALGGAGAPRTCTCPVATAREHEHEHAALCSRRQATIALDAGMRSHLLDFNALASAACPLIVCAIVGLCWAWCVLCRVERRVECRVSSAGVVLVRHCHREALLLACCSAFCHCSSHLRPACHLVVRRPPSASHTNL